MFSTLLTKKNLPALLTIGILTFTVGILFWYGQNKIQEAQDIQTTIVAWENLDNQITAPITRISNLNLFIQNLQSQKNIYQLDFIVNNEVVDSQKIEVRAKQKITVQPTKKTLDKIKELVSENKEILYQIKVAWKENKEGEILGKWVSPKLH